MHRELPLLVSCLRWIGRLTACVSLRQLSVLGTRSWMITYLSLLVACPSSWWPMASEACCVKSRLSEVPNELHSGTQWIIEVQKSPSC